MKRFKNILAVYDGAIGSDDALGRAVSLAASNGAKLTIVDVLPEKQRTARLLAEREKRLQRLVPAIDGSQMDGIETQVLCGTPFLEIVRAVLRSDYDLVVASAEGGSILRNVFFGSTATHLIRKSPCPVWIVKPGRPDPFARILAAVDPCAGTEESNALNKKIMDLATSLAEAHDGHLHIVHAWEVEGKDRETLASEITDQTRTDLCDKHEALHYAALGDLLEPYPLAEIEHEIHLPQGLPQRCISEMVDSLDIDLIVMGTVSRTGIPGLLMGNAAESVLASVNCGVLTVKPEGFITPVTLPYVAPVASSAA